MERFDKTSSSEVITEFALALATETAGDWAPIGTAIVVAPQLILTARHVAEGIWQPHHLRRPDKQSDSALIAFQVLPGAVGALWHANNAYLSPHTDLVLLDILPYSQSATSYKWHKVMINLAPLQVGQVVLGFGYSGGRIQPCSDHNADLQWNAHPRTTQGRVVAVHHAGRDRGLYNFPCFEMSARIEPGMSGGPLFDEHGRLCALVCGGGLEREDGTAITYGTPLWPLLLVQGIKGRFDGETDHLFGFYELVNRGAIAATGLEALEILELEDGRLSVAPREPVI